MFAVGLAVYATAKGDSVYFLRWAGYESFVVLPAVLVGSMPSFLHAAGVILLLSACTPSARPAAVGRLCAIVFLAEATFEAGQLPPLSGAISNAVPASWHGIAGLQAIPAYFENGTFDAIDLAAVAGASVLCFFVLTSRWRRG